VAALSIGQRQVVEIARALVDDARVLVLDEPTSSLAAADAAKLFETIVRLSSQGIAVIYISHFLEEVKKVCDSYLVLRDGEVAGQGDLAGVNEREIVELMVGRSVDDLFPRIQHTPGEPWLMLRDVAGDPLPRSVSMVVRRGEIFGLAGLVGAGRTETLRLIAGLDRCKRGEISANGQALVGSVGDRIERGIAMVSEDRKHEGLAQIMSISDNIVLSHTAPYSSAGWLRQGKRRDAVTRMMENLQVKAASPEAAVATLSGGNQQKVAIARVLHQDAQCLLFDEPTRGVDVGTKAEIYRLMGKAAAEGRAVVFVSSYFRELLELCDTIAVMARGTIVALKPANEWTEHDLLLAAMGQSEPGRASR
jgi:ribose transport system ATP-binding protein